MIDTQKHIVLTHLEKVATTFELIIGVEPDKADELAVKFCAEAIEKAVEEGKHIFTDEEFEQFYGRTYGDSPDIDGRVWIASSEALTEGEFVQVTVDGVVDGDLTGYIVEE